MTWPIAAIPVAPVSATALTGYSGCGKKMIEQYQAWHARQMDGERQVDAALSAPRPYALGLAHKHIPEMTACSRRCWTTTPSPKRVLPTCANVRWGWA